MPYTPEAKSLNGYYFKDAYGRELIATETASRQTAISNEASTRREQIQQEAITRQSEINNEATTRQEQFNQLQTQIQNMVQNGFVPYAVSSTSEMTDTDRIYVLKSTGKWYYYDTNTSTWTIGGDYQASSSADVLSKIASGDLGETVDLSTLTWVLGGVNATNHKLTTTDTDRIRFKDIIKAKKGSVINFSGVSAGYQFKVSIFKHLPQMFNTFISEPVALADNATTYTLETDGYIVITIKNTNGNISSDNIATVANYISGSTIYLAKENEDYGNVTGTLDRFTDMYWGTGKSIAESANGYTMLSEVRVNAGDIAGLLRNDGSSSTTYVVFINKFGEAIEIPFPNSSQQPMNGYVAPANSKYVIASYQTVIGDNNVMLHTMKKPDQYQQSIRIITEGTPVKLIAHRGLEAFAPEATIPAYTIAGQKGMWGCKLDICETSDGYFVMSHDASVDRVFNGTGNIIDMTLSELEALTVDAGSHIEDYPNEKIVTLEQALVICKKYQMHPIIEMKYLAGNSSVANVVAILEKYGVIENTICQCSAGNRHYLATLRMLCPTIPIVYWAGSPNELTLGHSSLPLFNATQALSSWNTDYDTATYLNLIRSFGMPLCVAVTDGDSALTKTNKAITNGAVYIVTDQITPEDIAPIVYE